MAAGDTQNITLNFGSRLCLDDPECICCNDGPSLKGVPCLSRAEHNFQYDRQNKQKSLCGKKLLKNVHNEKNSLLRSVKLCCKPTKPGKQLEATLGAPVGLSASTSRMNFSTPEPADLSLQGFATVLIAYAEYFIVPEVEWDKIVLNQVLLEGQKLFNESNVSLLEDEVLEESSIKRDFVLCGNTFHVMVNDPFLMGRVVGDAPPTPSLHSGLEDFFKKFQFCLLQIGSWYVLLWKNYGVFFFFDCFGRRIGDLRSDQKRGTAVLICLRNLENVNYLLLKLSGVQPDQLFSIRQLQLKSLTPCGGKPTPEITDRTNQYQVLHPDYAVLRASIHLHSHCFKEVEYRHSVCVAIAALINAKIDPAPVWDSGVLDKVLKLGAHLHKQWTQSDGSMELSIQDVPAQFVFGQFSAEIVVNADAECGVWKCTPNFLHSDLSETLERAFDRGANLILHIQGRSYAIWRKGTFYFLLDPFSHKCSLGKEKLRTASLHMCGGFAIICCVVTQSLLDLFEESTFAISLVKIVCLEELSATARTGEVATYPCVATPLTGNSTEVKSINDSVVGPEEFKCTEEHLSHGDLDSPCLSQLNEDTDVRQDSVEDSEPEEEDEDADNAENDDHADRSEGSDGDDVVKERPKKSRAASKKDQVKEKDAGGDASDAGDKGDLKQTNNGVEDTRNEDKSEEPAAQERIEEEAEKAVRTGEQPTEGILAAEEIPEDHPIEELPTEEERSESEPVDAPQEPNANGEAEKPSVNEQQQGEPRTSTNDTTPHTQDKKRRQRQPRKDNDDSSSDEKPPCRMPPGCLPNAYPGFSEDPKDLAVVGSESGSYESLCKLLKSAFRCADRVLTMTPWGNYVAFRANKTFFIFDGCTCNLRSIRHLDLSVGTAGLLCFSSFHGLISYIESGKTGPLPSNSENRDVVDQICNQYCAR